ncbi:MAG: hypothetical protein N2111_13055 [Candidatus Sumerlaeaceae bacterium]|nr:hypothetical protein [Candidatus Sumerlaeaceae bacterium]
MSVLIDLRTVEPEGVIAWLGALEHGAAQGAKGEAPLLTAWQAARLTPADAQRLGSKAVVVVPDFLNYARLLNTGQAATMLGLSGSSMCMARAVTRAGLVVASRPHLAAAKDFWLVARALAAFDLALLPRGFRGAVLLHSYLSDFAFVFEKRDFCAWFMRGAARRGIAGLHTQQLPLALSCLARWDLRPGCCAFLCPPSGAGCAEALAAARREAAFSGCRFLGDLTSLPPDFQSATVSASWADPPLDGVICGPRHARSASARHSS